MGDGTTRGTAGLALGLAAAGLAIGGARAMRAVASADRDAWPKTYEEPYAPSPGMTPYVSLGQRELLADLLWIRLLGYFGGTHDTADGDVALVEATQAADPYFQRVYTDGVRAIMSAHNGLTLDHQLRAAALAERGMTYFPKDYAIADLAGTIYAVQLTSKDAAQKRAWREKGASLLEKALRMPGAPAEDAAYVAYLQSTLGQHERAKRDLEELYLVTNDDAARDEIARKLAALEQRDHDELQVELDDQRHAFQAVWWRERPELPDTMYVVVGPHPTPYIDFRSLATERDLVDPTPDVLEPIDYNH